MSNDESQASLGRAMSKEERRGISKAVMDIGRFDYTRVQVFDQAYFRAEYPGFADWVYEVLELYERGMRYKEFKVMMRKKKRDRESRALQGIKQGDFEPIGGTARGTTDSFRIGPKPNGSSS